MLYLVIEVGIYVICLGQWWLRLWVVKRKVRVPALALLGKALNPLFLSGDVSELHLHSDLNSISWDM